MKVFILYAIVFFIICPAIYQKIESLKYGEDVSFPAITTLILGAIWPLTIAIYFLIFEREK